MSFFNEEDDFSVDRFQLELEAERNSKLIRKWGKKLSLAVAAVKDAKRILEFVETEQAEIIRSNKKSYGIDKATDKVVFGLVKNEPEYVKAFQKYLIAVRREEDCKSAVLTCQQRGMMIRVLTEQWLNNYYSKPAFRDNSSKRAKLKAIREEDNETNDDY